MEVCPGLAEADSYMICLHGRAAYKNQTSPNLSCTLSQCQQRRPGSELCLGVEKQPRQSVTLCFRASVVLHRGCWGLKLLSAVRCGCPQVDTEVGDLEAVMMSQVTALKGTFVSSP